MRNGVDSMECCCHLRNVQDLLADGRTLYERRFGEPFAGPIIPSGAMVEYHPILAKDPSRLHQFGKKVLTGMFLGSALVAGNPVKGDILAAETHENSSIYQRPEMWISMSNAVKKKEKQE